MIWWQSASIAIVSIVITFMLNSWLEGIRENRQFRRYRREKIFEEMESLKAEIGVICELAKNWKSFEQKQAEYLEKLSADHQLVGKYSKYPDVARRIRDILHKCNIIASEELKPLTNNLPKLKSELDDEYREFIIICDEAVDVITRKL